MLYEEIKPHIGKRAILTDIDGRIFMGIITNTVSKYDTSSGKEEIELDTGKVYYGFPFEEIKSIIDIE